MQEFTLASAGAGLLRCALWLPEGEIRAVVQLVHGISEYLDRYDDFARFLCANGFAVAAEDHMGHGSSVSPECPLGCFVGGWDAAVADVAALLRHLKERFPGRPVFLFGHSMGSFLTRTLLYTEPDAGLAGAVISGTGWQPEYMLKIGTFLCNREIKKHGEQYASEKIQKLMFGAYNKGFKDAKTPYDWLSSVPEVVERYIADPLCGFTPSVGLCRDMLEGIARNQKPENLRKMPKALPVFFLSGALDPVGAQGKGVKDSLSAFHAAGLENLSMRLYPGGRHEMLNEKEHETVYRNVLDWMNLHL